MSLPVRSPAEEPIWALLDTITDPEIPVVSLVEMGIIRGVALSAEAVQITMTPTFSGCPALHEMRRLIVEKLSAAGYSRVEVLISHDPPWTSDWINPAARRKLKEFGLAPPPRLNGAFAPLTLLDVVRCPFCSSTNTELKNPFGATLCRAIYYCNNCRQPFEQFKPL